MNVQGGERQARRAAGQGSQASAGAGSEGRARQEGAGGDDATWARPADRERRAGADAAAGTERRMGLGVRARSAGQGGAPGTRPGSRHPSPPARRRVWASGDQRPRAPRDAGPRGPWPSPRGPPDRPGRPPAHLSRERPQAREPRSSRVAASTTAAILGLRPPLLASLPTPPPAPRPPDAGPCRSGARFRCAERKPRREAGSGGRAAGDGGGGLAPRPGRSRSHGAAAAGLGRAGAPGPAAMSGYARRPGISPLSRARSLVIPDAAAFSERRAGLPQLDCERPRGRDPDPHFFGIRPTFMCYVPSPVLANVGDTDFIYGKGKGSKPGPQEPRRYALEVEYFDEKLADLEEANPFSFKEFLKTKNLSLLKEDAANSRLHAQVPGFPAFQLLIAGLRWLLGLRLAPPCPSGSHRHSLGLDCSSPPSQPVGFGLEFQQPFFEDPTGAGDLLDEDEDEDGWNGAYLPSAVEQTHSRVSASTSPCSTYISFFSSPSEPAGPESLPPWTLSDSDSRVSPVAKSQCRLCRPRRVSGGQAPSDAADELRSIWHSSRASFSPERAAGLPVPREQPAVQEGTRAELKDENSKLRRKLTEVQSFSETQTEMVRTLERKLEAKMIKEESDYHDLESVVQQVEQNLELMTKRAVKAESHVMKLKQDISLLQAQVSNFKRENEALRSGQGASLTVVKQNTDVALQNLRMVMSNAHTSIKQLVSGAETLNLVAEILKSIDRISEIKEVGEEES
ncbi:hypothetical protein QTO34_004976 [Cnephaeus nilssonii]|uniref:Endosome-associated-trafficking regulator 1 n=1 Tax=Cnephaeus nilssonii TaxID=3371016 RepID=A0AA40HMI1_CNENI|nr:hypothetical protein QTO34_004976 [Eptesicus nilssonii]